MKEKLTDLKNFVNMLVTINSYLAINKIPPLDLIVS